jgi:hydrogenase maturation protease
VVLGVGNLLLSDEGMGPLAVEYLRERWDFGTGVELVDGATAGVELMNIFGGAARLVVVDTVLGGAEPGAIYCFSPDDVPVNVRYRASIHQAHLLDGLALAALIGPVPEVTVVGVEPADIDSLHVGLTPALQARLPAVAEVVLEELARSGVHPRRRRQV